MAQHIIIKSASEIAITLQARYDKIPIFTWPFGPLRYDKPKYYLFESIPDSLNWFREQYDVSFMIAPAFEIPYAKRHPLVRFHDADHYIAITTHKESGRVYEFITEDHYNVIKGHIMKSLR